MTTPIYQLWARGNSMNGWVFRMKSKAVFLNRAEAEKYVEYFRARCIDPNEFECADPEGLEITIGELELHDLEDFSIGYSATGIQL
jgi:hypothetical protein